MRRVLAIVLSAAMVTTGCASAGPRMTVRSYAAQAPSVVNTASMADYVQRLPVGSRVRVDRSDGSSMRGTLMKASAGAILVQKNTRIPEPPVEVPLAEVLRVTLENGHTSTGKAVAIGIASGVGAFLGILAILAATLDD